MRTHINQVHEDQSKLFVEFYSPNGNGIGLWNGTAPKIGDTLDVELDIDEVFSWQKNIKHSSDKKLLITTINNTTQITAKLILGINDNCAALKLGDSIILIEVEEPVPRKSGLVQITTTKLNLYPTNT